MYGSKLPGMNNFHQAFVKIKIPTAFAFEKVINNATQCFSKQAGAAAMLLQHTIPEAGVYKNARTE